MSDRSRLRLVVLRVVVLSVVATLLGRLAYLQVHDGPTYRTLASANRVREVITPAARGVVLDDRGVPLVSNRTALVVSVNRGVLRTAPHHGAEVLTRLSAVIGIPAAQLATTITPCGEDLGHGRRAKSPDCWNGSPYQPVPVAQYSTDQPAQIAHVLSIEEHAEDFRGVSAQYEAVREYPQRTLAAHSLGYLGQLSAHDLEQAKYRSRPAASLIGRGGVEATYDDELHGTDGVQRLLVDKNGTVTGSLGTDAPKAGADLVLSLDSGVQKVAESALAAGIARARASFDKTNGRNYRAPSGAVVVMEAATGRLVALASNPTYDPTAFASRAAYAALSKDPAKPLISNATQGLFAPGSTFKISSTAAAVAAGNSLYGTYACPTELKVGNRIFHNFEGETFGNIDFHTTLVKSCDTVYYQLALDQWTADGATVNKPGAREVFTKMARSWGFGARTGVDLPDERIGTITDRRFKVRYWQHARTNYCKGAQTRPKGSYQQQVDQEFCSDGYRYNAGDAVNFAIGQGDVLVTPLQVTAAYAALANGGTLFQPQLAKGLLSADGRTVTPLAPAKRRTLPVAPVTLAYMRDALVGVVQKGGTAQDAFAKFPFDKLLVAGKTGTADVHGKSPTSWFASYAPAAAPKYVVVVMVPEAGTGGTTAAPIARAVYDGMYGLEGQKGVLGAGGSLPAGLPVVRADGSVAPPGTPVPTPPVVVPLHATAEPGAATHVALGAPGGAGPGGAGLPGLPVADLPDRRRQGGGA